MTLQTNHLSDALASTALCLVVGLALYATDQTDLPLDLVVVMSVALPAVLHTIWAVAARIADPAATRKDTDR